MGLNFKKWLLEKLGADQKMVSAEDIAMSELWGNASELYVRELAFWQCVNLIAGTIGKCEFKTYQNGAEQKGEEWYRWNVSPNLNQSSSVFLNKLIAKLFSENQALVIEINGQLLVADSYSYKEYALLDNIFTEVTVGDFHFDKSFIQSDVLFFRLHARNMKPLINGLYENYRKLIEYSIKAYQKSRGTKGILEVDAMATGKDFNEKYQKMINENRFKTFAEAESAIFPLFKGLKYTETGGKTYSQEGTRDIRAMIDDVGDFTARALGVPPTLLSGNVEGIEDALNQYLTFRVDPLCNLLAEEINKKLYGKSILSGTYMAIDTKRVKHVDLLSVSTSIDKLIASGAFCINDIRKLVGEPPIEEPWANQHWMTKNYSTVQELLEMINQTANPEAG